MAKQSLLFFCFHFLHPSSVLERVTQSGKKNNNLKGERLSCLVGLEGEAGAGKESKAEVVKRLRSSICELLTAVTWNLLSQLHSASPAAEQQRGSGSEVDRVGQCVSDRFVALIGELLSSFVISGTF